MADIPAINEGLIQEEETQFKGAVSEYTWRRMGSNMNFTLQNHLFHHLFKINGPISSFLGKTGVDGTFSFPYNAVIVDAVIYMEVNGSSGSFTVDVQKSVFPNGAYASIFSTIPSISSAAAADTTCGVGDVVAGCTAPVISGGSVLVNAKDRIKMNVTAVPGGFPENAGIEIIYRVR